VEVVAVADEDFPEAELIWLEAKQVLRGMDSELYPKMTFAQAMAIRMMGLDQLRESLKAIKKEGEGEVD
jgi:hypothetical protein